MSPSDKQVLIRPTSDENVREYHLVGQKISEVPYAEFYLPLYESGSDFDQLGTEGKKAADKLMNKSNGQTITRIVFRPESVRVYKTPMSDWGKVESEIVLPALNGAFGTNFRPIQYGTIKHRELERELVHA